MNKPICKILHGSHLYGLNTPQSDTDYKGVFLPSLSDLILKKDEKHISKNSNNTDTRNTSKDIDFEMFSLHSFLDLVASGQPMALEMLYSPREMIIESSPIWEYIIGVREFLVTKESKAFVGYCKGQASKYCIKGDRLQSLEQCLEVLKTYDPQSNIEAYAVTFLEKMLVVKHFQFNPSVDEHGSSFSILGKKFYFNCKVQTVVDSLKHTRNRYGNRSKVTQEMGGKDWKALSHAVRIALEVKELLEDGKITLPFKQPTRDFLMRIKLGKVPLAEVEEELTFLLDCVEDAREESKLPERINKSLLDRIIYNAYEVIFGDSGCFACFGRS